MQEDITQKTIALAIKTAKLDGRVLQAAFWKLLQMYRKKRDTPHHGKQTLKQLMKHGTGVSNIEITDANIKSFFQHRQEVRHRLLAEKGRNRNAAPLPCVFQGARH